MRIADEFRIYESTNIIVEQVYLEENLEEWYYQFYIWDDSDNTGATFWFKNEADRQNKDKVNEIMGTLKSTGVLDLVQAGLVYDGAERR